MQFSLPYSELNTISEEERAHRCGNDAPLEFGHTPPDLIGGRIGAGFVITGFYEDTFPGALISDYCDPVISVRTVKR